ncbi:MAG TPA: 5-formyltetrahydrofolate cyclo-ligase [Ohtaekwangia sp.]
MTKAELRKIYLEKRLALSDAEYLQLSRQLCDIFFVQVDLTFVKVVHVFIPIEKNREPDTWLIIDRIRREFPHVRLSVPRVNAETKELDNFFFEGLHQLAPNSWGIREPKQGILTPYEKIDMVITPMLVFDRNGQRVGYGKGFYDKLFAKCSPSCKRIGLSLFPPVERIDDIREFDEPLSMVLTPANSFVF